jgi:hypothetical protein
VQVEGVEPTNNAAERSIRPGVLWRKGSFGTQSAEGSRFVESMLTVVSTLKQQQRNIFVYLTAACEAALHGEAAPSLLPPPPAYMLAGGYAGGNITVERSLTVNALSGGNANLHANGSLNFLLGSAPSLVQGFGHYGGGISMGGGQPAAQVFVPPVNPDQAPPTSKVSTIAAPSVVASNYESIATKKSYSTVSLNGLVTLGTSTDPEIWYVDGNVQTGGPVVFAGYGAIVIKGNLRFDHSIVMSDLTPSSVVFYVEGNINIAQGNLALSSNYALTFVGANLTIRTRHGTPARVR